MRHFLILRNHPCKAFQGKLAMMFGYENIQLFESGKLHHTMPEVRLPPLTLP